MKIMNRTLLILLLAGSVAVADTTMDQLLKMRFSGAGKFINVFAGKVAKEGLATRTAISGERRATMTGRNIEVIDLGEQMIWRYAVSRKGKAKKCEAMTFDEFREQMAAFEQLPFFGDGPHAGEMPDDAVQAPEYEVTLSFTQTDEQETHAGMTGDVFQFTAIAHRCDGLPERTQPLRQQLSRSRRCAGYSGGRTRSPRHVGIWARISALYLRHPADS